MKFKVVANGLCTIDRHNQSTKEERNQPRQVHEAKGGWQSGVQGGPGGSSSTSRLRREPAATNSPAGLRSPLHKKTHRMEAYLEATPAAKKEHTPEGVFLESARVFIVKPARVCECKLHLPECTPRIRTTSRMKSDQITKTISSGHCCISANGLGSGPVRAPPPLGAAGADVATSAASAAAADGGCCSCCCW